MRCTLQPVLAIEFNDGEGLDEKNGLKLTEGDPSTSH